MLLSLKIIECFVLLCAIRVVELSLKDAVKDQAFRIYKNLASGARNLRRNPGISADQIEFQLYQNENSTEYIRVDTDNLERFRGTTNQIVFLIHGYISNSKTRNIEELKNTFLVRDKSAYVINVNWEKAADQLYYISALNTYDVANVVAKLIIKLYQQYDVNKSNILLVGHSLGGQICGYVGKIFKDVTQEKLSRIIALDPAGPLFVFRPDNERLNPNDADVVEVIHTDGGVFGFPNSCGTIDFFVNGGRSQPGCKQIDLADIIGTATTPLVCDHLRAWDYFTEALLNPQGFTARKCYNSTYNRESCKGDMVSMGDLNVSQKGNFYLETNRQKPFARNTFN